MTLMTKNETDIEKIMQFLDFSIDNHNNCELLYKYYNLHRYFKAIDLKIFYFFNYKRSFSIFNEKTTVAEIFANCTELLDSLDDIFYCCVLANNFIIKNNIEMNHVEIEDDLSKFNNDINKMIINYKFKYKSNTRVVNVVNSQLISPFIFLIEPEIVFVSKNSFNFLISNQVNISKILTFNDFNGEMIDRLVLEISKNECFREKCKRYILEHGISNIATLIVSSILNLEIKPFEFKSNIQNRRNNKIGIGCFEDDKNKNIDYLKLPEYFCCNHFSMIYIPFTEFSDFLDITTHELYYFYLRKKQSIKLDLDDIRMMFEDLEHPSTYDSFVLDSFTSSYDELRSSKKRQILDVTRYEHYNSSCQPIKANLDVISSTLDSLKIVDVCNSKSTLSSILELIILSNLEFPFCDIHIKYLNELKNESYYQKVMEKYYKRDDNKKNIVFEFLNQNANGIDCFLPLIDFNDIKLSNTQYDMIMTHYCTKYDVNDLIHNFLLDVEYSESVLDFFKSNLERVKLKVKKALIMCKLGLPLDIKKYKTSEINLIMENSKRIDMFRDRIINENVVKKHIILYLERSIDILNENFNIINITDQFGVIYVQFLFKKYELICCQDRLLSLIDQRKPKILIEIQNCLILLLKSLFIEDSYFEVIEKIYKKALEVDNIEVKKRNDKLLLSIIKGYRSMGKDTMIGNLK